MFCNECGSKLTPADKHCRSCGTPTAQAQACGGFWGLTGLVPPPLEEIPSPAPAPMPEPAPEKKKTMAVRWIAAVAVLLVLLLVQTIRVGVINSRVDALELKADYYRDMYQELANQGDDTPTPEVDVPAPTAPAETTAPQETTVPQDTTVPEEEIPETSVPEETDPVDGQDIVEEPDVDAAVDDAVNEAVNDALNGIFDGLLEEPKDAPNGGDYKTEETDDTMEKP